MISVIIPCFNQARFLSDAIESALAQTYSDVEIIVIDDGSTDDTTTVAKKYAEVHLMRQENQGLSAARNAGVRESRGDFLVFLDADDKLLPDALTCGFDSLSIHPDAAFTSGHYRYIHADGSVRYEFSPRTVEGDRYLAFLRGNYVGMHATVMYRRECWETSGGFDTSLSACEDYDMYLRLSREHKACGHDHLIAEYRRHDSNMSHDYGGMLTAALRVLAKQWGHVKENSERLSAYREGVRFWRNHYWAEAWDSPERWRAIMRYFPVLARSYWRCS